MGDVILTTEKGRVIKASTGGLAEINSILNPHRKGIVAIDLTADGEDNGDGVPETIRAALQTTDKLPKEERDKILEHFTPTKERYLEIIKSSGFEPHHADGGSLKCSTYTGFPAMHEAVEYPILVELPIGSPPNNKFFDMHINHQSDQTGMTRVAELDPDESKLVNEIHFVLSGKAVWWHATSKGKEGVCMVEVIPGTDRAWIMHYSGTGPHGAVLPAPKDIPTRVLSCVIGAPSFVSFFKHPSIPRHDPWMIDGVLKGGGKK